MMEFTPIHTVVQQEGQGTELVLWGGGGVCLIFFVGGVNSKCWDQARKNTSELDAFT